MRTLVWAIGFAVLGSSFIGCRTVDNQVIFPDGSFDGSGIRGLDRVDASNPPLPVGATVVALDGAVVGTVAADGAVITQDGSVVGGIAPDGAVLTADGSVLGTVVLDASVSMDATPMGDRTVPNDMTVPVDMTLPDGTMTGDRTVPNDGAFVSDGRTGDGSVACPMGWRTCGALCIPPGSCCTDGDCPGRVCNRPGGTCGCVAATRYCGSRCIPESSCCGNSECPTGSTCRAADGLCVGASGCILGLRSCGGATCIPVGNCCTNADCPGGTCPAMGAMCTGPMRCATGSRDCMGTCIPSATCCNNTDCAGGLVCLEPGRTCSCPMGQRRCNERCIPNEACCVDEECPGTRCVTVGMVCPPIPPRIAVKRWGILPDGDAGPRPSFAHYELTTTAAEEATLRSATVLDMPTQLVDERYFTIYGLGVCPTGTATLWSLEETTRLQIPRADRILTVSNGERTLLVADGWTATAVGCAVSSTPSCPSDMVPIVRLQQMTMGVERHRFSRMEDTAEAAVAGFRYESIAFCVW
jgi:hypothetical protein